MAFRLLLQWDNIPGAKVAILRECFYSSGPVAKELLRLGQEQANAFS